MSNLALKVENKIYVPTLEESREILRKTPFQNYLNSREIFSISGTPFLMEDIVKAALISRLNMGLLGDAGNGKTQLMKDVYGFFGNEGQYFLGRNDLNPKELFRTFNLENLKNARTTAEISQITDAINLPIIVADEFNRCIEGVQNQFFNLFDGYIEINGKIYPLGKNSSLEETIDDEGKVRYKNSKYSIGIAAANYGSKYVGTSGIDKAMLERLHLILDLDNFIPTPYDLAKVAINARNPRTKDSEGSGIFNAISTIYGDVKTTPATLEQIILMQYLTFGLDYLPGFSEKSKKQIKNVFPSAIENLTGNDAAKKFFDDNHSALLYPMSPRGALTTLSLAIGLEKIYEIKTGKKAGNQTEPFFNALKLIAPYSGVLANDRILKEEFNGNAFNAMKSISDEIKKKFDEENTALKEQVISDSISQIEKQKNRKLSEEEKNKIANSVKDTHLTVMDSIKLAVANSEKGQPFDGLISTLPEEFEYVNEFCRGIADEKNNQSDQEGQENQTQ